MSVTSPPPSTTTTTMSVVEKNHRRVRFSLPEAKLTLNTDKKPVHVHGTSMYVNGTLINVTSTIHSTTSEPKSNGGALKNEIKSSLKATGGGGNAAISNGKESSQCKVTFNIKPTSVSPLTIASNKEPRHSSLPTPLPSSSSAYVSGGNNNSQTSATVVGRRRLSKSSNGHRQNLLPMIGRKSSSVEDFDESEIEQANTNLTKYKSSDDLRDPNTFKMISKNNNTLRLPEATSHHNHHHKALKHPIMTPNVLKVPTCDLNGECK